MEKNPKPKLSRREALIAMGFITAGGAAVMTGCDRILGDEDPVKSTNTPLNTKPPIKPSDTPTSNETLKSTQEAGETTELPEFQAKVLEGKPYYDALSETGMGDFYWVGGVGRIIAIENRNSKLYELPDNMQWASFKGEVTHVQDKSFRETHQYNFIGRHIGEGGPVYWQPLIFESETDGTKTFSVGDTNQDFVIRKQGENIVVSVLNEDDPEEKIEFWISEEDAPSFLLDGSAQYEALKRFEFETDWLNEKISEDPLPENYSYQGIEMAGGFSVHPSANAQSSDRYERINVREISAPDDVKAELFLRSAYEYHQAYGRGEMDMDEFVETTQKIQAGIATKEEIESMIIDGYLLNGVRQALVMFPGEAELPEGVMGIDEFEVEVFKGLPEDEQYKVIWENSVHIFSGHNVFGIYPVGSKLTVAVSVSNYLKSGGSSENGVAKNMSIIPDLLELFDGKTYINIDGYRGTLDYDSVSDPRNYDYPGSVTNKMLFDFLSRNIRVK